mgnify:CR=1 FL=1
MSTPVETIWLDAALPGAVERAAALLRAGKVVAFPTETVYGLGADATQADAVARIFAAKGRPQDNPLIVHVCDLTMLAEYAYLPAQAELERIARFWPGPLTVLLRRRPSIPDVVTASLPTAGFRMPRHPVALELIRRTGHPLAAPSANRSGRPSPTTAQHVWDDLQGRITAILDGGACAVGVESTVLDLSVTPPCILRLGGLPQEALRAAWPDVTLHPAIRATLLSGSDSHGERPAQPSDPAAEVPAKSPGMRYRHYAPSVPLIVIRGRGDRLRHAAREAVLRYKREGRRVALLLPEEEMERWRGETLISFGRGSDPSQVAARLFAALRAVEQAGVDVALVLWVPLGGVGATVEERLVRAASQVIDVLRPEEAAPVGEKGVRRAECAGDDAPGMAPHDDGGGGA